MRCIILRRVTTTLLWMLIWLGLIVMVICLKMNLTHIVLNTRLVKMEGLANAVCTKLLLVKVTRRRLLCKRLPRKTRILIRVTRWGGFGRSLQLVENPSLTPVKFSGVEIHPAGASDEISPEEVCWRLESEGAVKVAPRLDEQLAGKAEDRSNIITYTPRTCCIPQTFTLDDLYRGDRAELTEYETLCQLDGFFAYVESLNGKYANEAKSMRENLTFIGEKEYKEAAAGIAASWKAALEANTDLQICVIAGEIKINKNQIKSDEYLLDNILANFTEEDWEKYGDRIIVDRDDIANMPKENLRVVLLDDWTISGSQLRDVYHSLVDQYPEIEDQIEMQLIVANEQRIKYGLSVDELMGDGKKIPVRAYFSAHDSKTAKNGAYITGFRQATFQILMVKKRAWRMVCGGCLAL